MSSEHHFGVGRGRVAPSIARRLDHIANKHGAGFVRVVLPGDGPRYWFACINRGEPFDSSTERAVLDECRAAGIWPIGGAS